MFGRSITVVLFSVFMLMGFCVHAAEDEQTLKEKAASQLIESMPDFFKDVVALQKMTPAQKIDYILTQSEGRIKEKIAEKFQEDLKTKLTKYALEAIRAKAFMTDALPKIRNAYAMGEAFNWGSIDAEIASGVDTKMRVFSGAISTAKIGWGAYEAYNSGGSLEAFKSISGEVYDLLADAYIPGWGYIKLGKAMVEILGRYVLDYATDTAVEGMLNDMYSMKSNPQALAEWLINKAPSDIQRDLDSKWNDGMGFGRLWEGQGTDKGDEVMKKRISGTLISLRGELLVRQKEEERKEAALTEKINDYLYKAKEAEAETKAVTQKAHDTAKIELDKIRQFQFQLNGIAKGEAEKRIADAEKAFQEEMKDTLESISYQSIDRKSVITAFESALNEIQESGRGGYDPDAYSLLMQKYTDVRRSVLESGKKGVADGVVAAQKAINGINAKYAGPIQDARDDVKECNRKNLRFGECPAHTTLNGLITATQNASAPFEKVVYGELSRRYAADVAVLVAEENKLRVEAFGRMSIRYEDISSAFTKAKAEVEPAFQRYSKDLGAFGEEVDRSMNFPNYWRVTSIAFPSNFKTKDIFETPGDVVQERDSWRQILKQLDEDKHAANNTLRSLERKVVNSYRTGIEKIKKDLVDVLPEAFFSISYGDRANPGEVITTKRFDAYEVKLKQKLSHEASGLYIRLPQMYSLSFDEYESQVLGVDPLQALVEYEKEIKARLAFLDNLADADAMGKSFIAIYQRLNSIPMMEKTATRDMAQEAKYQAEAFNTREGMSGYFRHVELTEGASYLTELKALWETQGKLIEMLGRFKKAMGKAVQYKYFYRDKAYQMVDNWLLIPEKLKLAEAEYKKSLEITTARLGLADKYLGEWKEKVAGLMEGSSSARYRVQEIEKIAKAVNNQVSLLKSWGPHKDVQDRLKNTTDFKEELAKTLAEAKKAGQAIEAKDRADSERRQAEYEAEQGRLKAEEARKKEEEARRAAAPVMVMYNLMDPRLNTVSLRAASGEVIVSRSDLRGGALELTARLDTLQTIATILASEEGMTWKELPLSNEVAFSFMPMPGKVYAPVLRIKTTDFRNIDVPFFSNIQSIVYQDVDADQLVAQTVGTLAEAYERADFGSFSDHISREYLGNKATLEEGVRFDFDMFTDIRLKIYIDRIERRGNQFVAETRWDKSQTSRKFGEQQKTTGRTTMMFGLEEGKFKIRNLRGNLLYATLSPDIAQASGLSSKVVDNIRTAQQERDPVQPGAGSTIDGGGSFES